MRSAFLFAIHNVFIHPICGVLWLLGANKLANHIHDWTAPMTNDSVCPELKQLIAAVEIFVNADTPFSVEIADEDLHAAWKAYQAVRDDHQ